MQADRKSGRPAQRHRTRADLLRAASRLMRHDPAPTLEQIAAEAQVSRATAYRYFHSAEALLVEAAVDVAMPLPAELFPPGADAGPLERLEKLDDAVQAVIVTNETPLRRMLVHSLARSVGDGVDGAIPARQNRRTPLIDAALAPAQRGLRASDLRLLRSALALVIGTEARVVCRDVLGLDEAEARKVRRYAIRALLEAAQRNGPSTRAPAKSPRGRGPRRARRPPSISSDSPG